MCKKMLHNLKKGYFAYFTNNLEKCIFRLSAFTADLLRNRNVYILVGEVGKGFTNE